MKTVAVHEYGGDVCQSNMTALVGEAALLIPGHECSSPAAPSDFDRLISGYRLTPTTALLGDPHCFGERATILFRSNTYPCTF